MFASLLISSEKKECWTMWKVFFNLIPKGQLNIWWVIVMQKKCCTKKVIFIFWEKSFREEILVSTKNQTAETCARVWMNSFLDYCNHWKKTGFGSESVTSCSFHWTFLAFHAQHTRLIIKSTNIFSTKAASFLY
jgi:hypothetical protein